MLDKVSFHIYNLMSCSFLQKQWEASFFKTILNPPLHMDNIPVVCELRTLYTMFGGQWRQFYCIMCVTLYLVTSREHFQASKNVYNYHSCHDFRPYEMKVYTDVRYWISQLEMFLFYFLLSIHLGIKVSSLHSLYPNGQHLFLVLEPNLIIRPLCTEGTYQHSPMLNSLTIPMLYKSFLFSRNPFISTVKHVASFP